MGRLSLYYAIMSVAGVASATQSISLANFTPRIENLPSTCSAAYTSTIEGCQASDFAQNARCSPQCVQGLVKIAEVVTRQCAGVDVPETSIIGVFMLGAGVPAVCPGVQVTTIGKSSTQPPSQASTTRPPASSTTASDSGDDDGDDETSTSTTAASTASSTPVSASSSATSTAEQPSTTDRPRITLDTSVATPPPAATTSASSQKSNADSGGGSPFDVQAGAGTQLAPLRFGRGQLVALLGAVILFTFAA